MSLKSLLIPQLNQPTSRDRVPKIAEGDVIPRIIHQTFYDRNLPHLLQNEVAQLRQINPDWEYRFYDDDDIAAFIQSNYEPLVWRYFEKIDRRYGAARADLFRYLLMYKVGGVYFDIKSTATRPIELGIEEKDKFLLSTWAGYENGWGQHYELQDIPDGEYQQWFIACVPGHPFMKAVIENVLSNIDKYYPSLHGTGKMGVLRLTGPIAFSLAIHRILDQHHHRIVESRRELGFEYNVYSNQLHETVFKSHYSLQTESIVSLGWVKKQVDHFFTLLKAIRNGPST